MSSRREFEEVLDHLAAGRLRAVIDTVVPFERSSEAFQRFDAADLFGKIVVEGPSS